MMIKRMQALVVGLVVLVVAVGCAPAAEVAENTAVETEGETIVETVNVEAAPEVDRAEESSDAAAAPTGVAADEDFEAEESMEEAPAGDDGFGGAVGGGPDGESDEVGLPPVEDVEFQASLTAGEIDDNADFSAYLSYRTTYENLVGLGAIPDVDISVRHTVQVVTPEGLPVLGARVLFYANQELVTAMRTPSSGVVYFHPRAYETRADSYEVVVSKEQSEVSATFVDEAMLTIELDTAPAEEPVNLDVLFLLDATGSMGDEIAQLKDNILSISAQVNALPSNPNVRFGLVVYRDRGEEYVTRTYDFTDDVNAFQQVLNNVQADAGGDTPESLNEGLADAINDVDWRVEDTVSLVFLVADAPPHLDYEQDVPYTVSMQEAAELGIVIHPIASSGLDAQGEYIFRQIAQFTGGHFIFLTYEETPQEESGEPGRDDLSVTEGSYSVADLDALVVSLIEQEMAQLFEPVQ